MKDRAYHFEIRDLITQFIAAFDDVVIGRYNKDQTEMAQIKVRYVYSPKERVLFDLVNKAQNITLPVIAIAMTDVSRDESRVFNKLYGFDVPGKFNKDTPVNTTSHVNMPVPVNIGISMSIIANYQLDIDQIISNFVPYNNPYIILSWKLPEAFKLTHVQEIRSEVIWNGSIALKYPTDTTGSDKFRYEADTSFTIKGWLFPQAPAEPLKNIFFIDSNFYATRILDSSRFQGYETQFSQTFTSTTSSLSTNTLVESDTISISAAPQITNVYYTNNGAYQMAYGSVNLNTSNISSDLLLQGKMLQYSTMVLLSSNVSNFFNTLTTFNYEYYPPLSGYIVPLSCYQSVNENLLTIKLPKPLSAGAFDIVVKNNVGWDTTNKHNIQLSYTV